MAQGTVTAHEVPALPYPYNALEPHIDEQTMHIHHDKHHAAYVNNLNAAIEKHPELGSKSPEELISNLNVAGRPFARAVRNNGGGHVNHTMFWQIMGPTAAASPPAPWPRRSTATFGSFDAFKEKFEGGRRQPVRQRLGLAGRTSRGKLQGHVNPQSGQSHHATANARSWA